MSYNNFHSRLHENDKIYVQMYLIEEFNLSKFRLRHLLKKFLGKNQVYFTSNGGENYVS